MTFHVASFLLGLAAFPCLVLVALGLFRLAESLRAGHRASELNGLPSSRVEPLRFTPRLIGQLRRPHDLERDRARAS